MERAELPYKTLVLVCTNKRAAGERVSCAADGRCGAQLRDALKDEVAKRGLKSRVRVSAAGCLDLCEEGPNVVVVGPSGTQRLKGVAPEDVPAVLQKIADTL